MTLRIAIISEHASPLAVLGGVDAGGQNVYVDEIARRLGRRGHKVDVFTRRDAAELPGVVEVESNVRVVHVDAGPPKPIAKEQLLPHIPEFTRALRELIGQEGAPYDVIHANFWMSGLVAADLKQGLGIPFAVTFHALGRVRRAHQGDADGFPDDRFELEERVIREAD